MALRGPPFLFVLQYRKEAYIYIEVDAMNKRNRKLREKISNAFELPQDIIMDVAKVTIIGTNQVTIENHKGIIEYGENQIRINIGSGILILDGKHLAIKAILQEEITIMGEISGISF